jgi:hypothetical protein
VLHLSLLKDVDPLATNVHKSDELLVWQDKPVQLDGRGASGKMEPFQYEVLSDHFQRKPILELTTLPPTQQPSTASSHRLRAKFSS